MKIKKKILIKYLKKIYLIRFTEEEISNKYVEKKMRCPIHLSIGQEIPSAALNIILKNLITQLAITEPMLII